MSIRVGCGESCVVTEASASSVLVLMPLGLAVARFAIHAKRLTVDEQTQEFTTSSERVCAPCVLGVTYNDDPDGGVCKVWYGLQDET